MTTPQPILYQVVKPGTYNWQTKPAIYFEDTSNTKVVINNYLRRLHWIRPVSYGTFKSSMKVDNFGNVTVTGLCLTGTWDTISTGFYPLHYFADKGYIKNNEDMYMTSENGSWNTFGNNHRITWGPNDEYLVMEGIDIKELFVTNFTTPDRDVMTNPPQSLNEVEADEWRLKRLVSKGVFQNNHFNSYAIRANNFMFYKDHGGFNGTGDYGHENTSMYQYNPNLGHSLASYYVHHLDRERSDYITRKYYNFNLRSLPYTIINGNIRCGDRNPNSESRHDTIGFSALRWSNSGTNLLIAQRWTIPVSNLNNIETVMTTSGDINIMMKSLTGANTPNVLSGGTKTTTEFPSDLILDNATILPVLPRKWDTPFSSEGVARRIDDTSQQPYNNPDYVSVTDLNVEFMPDTLLNSSLPRIPWETTDNDVLLPTSEFNYTANKDIVRYPYNRTYPFIPSFHDIDDDGIYGCSIYNPTLLKTVSGLLCNYVNDRLMHYDKRIERPFWRMLTLPHTYNNDFKYAFVGKTNYQDQSIYGHLTYTDNIMGNPINIYYGMTVWPESYYPVEFLGVYPYPTTAREKYPHANYIPRYDGKRVSHPRQGEAMTYNIYHSLKTEYTKVGYVIPVNDGYIENGIVRGDVIYTQDRWSWYKIKDGTQLDVFTIDSATYRNFYTIINTDGKLDGFPVWKSIPAKTVDKLKRHCLPLRAHTPDKQYLKYTTDISRIFVDLSGVTRYVEVMDVFTYNVDRMEWSGNERIFTGSRGSEVNVVEGDVFTIYSLDKRLTIKVVASGKVTLPIDIENLPSNLMYVDYTAHNGRIIYRNETRMFKDRRLHLLNII